MALHGGRAYDHRSIYERLGAAGTADVVIAIPPPRMRCRRAHGRPVAAMRSGSTENSKDRTTRVAEGVGLGPASARRERILPIQVSARRKPAGEEQQGAKQRGHDRASHPQPNGRAWQAEFLRRGVLNDGWKSDPTRAEVESCNKAPERVKELSSDSRGGLGQTAVDHSRKRRAAGRNHQREVVAVN